MNILYIVKVIYSVGIMISSLIATFMCCLISNCINLEREREREREREGGREGGIKVYASKGDKDNK